MPWKWTVWSHYWVHSRIPSRLIWTYQFYLLWYSLLLIMRERFTVWIVSSFTQLTFCIEALLRNVFKWQFQLDSPKLHSQLISILKYKTTFTIWQIFILICLFWEWHGEHRICNTLRLHVLFPVTLLPLSPSSYNWFYFVPISACGCDNKTEYGGNILKFELAKNQISFLLILTKNTCISFGRISSSFDVSIW